RLGRGRFVPLRPARRALLHPSRRLPRLAGPGGAALRAPRRDRALASPRGPAAHARAPPRSPRRLRALARRPEAARGAEPGARGSVAGGFSALALAAGAGHAGRSAGGSKTMRRFLAALMAGVLVAVIGLTAVG